MTTYRNTTNTQAFTIRGEPMQVCTGASARVSLAVVNKGGGDIYLSYGIPPAPSTNSATYSGFLVESGKTFEQDINVSTDAVFIISTDALNGSNIVIIETIKMAVK